MAFSRSILLVPILLGCAPDIIEATSADEVGGTESAEITDGESTTTNESDSSESDSSSTIDDTTDDPTETSDTSADCVDIKCDPGNCLEGECVEVSSCKQLADLDTNDTLGDGVYQLDPDGDGRRPPYAAYCDMTTDGGGWTLVLKSDGDLGTFRYDSAQWGAAGPFQPEFPDLDRHEAKLTSYASVPMTELRIGLEAPLGVDPAPLLLRWITVPIAGSSLHALIAPDVLIPTTVGRDVWKSLVLGSSLQPNCNLEGINVMPSADVTLHHVRIGIVGNEQNDCNSPNSRIGIGGGGDKCATLPSATGNFAGCLSDNGDVNIIGFGVVLVR